MRILFDATALGSGLGGDETYLSGMLEGLAAVAPETDAFPLLMRSGASPPETVRGRRFPVRRIARRPGIVHYAVGMRGALGAERGRADVVHTITHAPLASPVPYVLTIGDLSFRHHPEHYPPAARARLNTLVPRQCRGARMVLTPSEFSRQDVIDAYGLDPERVRVVPNRVRPHVGTDDLARRRALRALRDAGVDGPFVLYLGNLHPRKNVARLVRAFDDAVADGALAGVSLVIAGGRWWKGGAEESAIARAKAGRIVMLGRVDDDTRRVLLEDAVALAYVSTFEGFGLPPIEAMAAGTAVIASSVTAVPEVCGDAALLVDPYDVDAIAGALRTVVTDDVRRADLQRRGRARAAQYDVTRTGTAAYAAFLAACGVADAAAPSGSGGREGRHDAGTATGGTEWPR